MFPPANLMLGFFLLDKTREACVAACRRIRRSQNFSEDAIVNELLSTNLSNTDLFEPEDEVGDCSSENKNVPEESYTTMTINEIINGSVR